MIKVPELTFALADEITRVAWTQLRTSRIYKQPRMDQIKESEDLYNGIVKKTLARESTEPFPFMSGFVDHLYSEIDEAPDVQFGHQDEADYKAAKMITAFFQNEKSSVLPHAKWNLKDRWSKKLAIFSGRAILKYYAESDPTYRSNLKTIDHYDFHNEPRGGGQLEDHLFCGEEGIFKTQEELEHCAEEGYYDASQVIKIVTNTGADEYKENDDEYNNRLNREQGLQMDSASNNYVGQNMFKLVEWYLTYRGVRWYCLFDERTMNWLRVKPLRELYTPIESIGEALWPYVSWATHEDPKVFWSKAPCDDARPIAKAINKLINQEIYNREKKNKGTRLYDPTMVTDIDALADERPDGLIPIDTKGGTRSLSQALYKVEHGEITGTIDLVSFLDSYHGQKSGSTPGAQGASEKDKKVGIFFGELQQVQKRLGIHNKSFREMYGELGLRFVIGVDDHMIGTMPVKMVGAGGIEWADMTAKDLKRKRPFEIKVTGGSEEMQRNEILSQKKSTALGAAATVNPRWKDKELLRAAGYTDDQLKDAFSGLDETNQELMSEAAEAIEMIQSGKKVPLNRGANAAFMQKIVDYANDLTLKDKKKEEAIALKLYAFAEAHADIAIENEARTAEEMIKQERLKAGGMMGMAGADSPEGVAEMASMGGNAAMNSAIPEKTVTPTSVPNFGARPVSSQIMM